MFMETLVPKSERSIGFRSFDYGTVVYWTHEEHFQFDGQMDLVKGVLKRFELDKFRTEGFDLFVHADAPPGSGLGSSSTFTVALIGLFRELLGLPITSAGWLDWPSISSATMSESKAASGPVCRGLRRLQFYGIQW